MSTKRKVLGEALGRRVRARREESEDLESVDSIQSFDKPRLEKEADSTSESEEESEEENEEDEQVNLRMFKFKQQLTAYEVRIRGIRSARNRSNNILRSPRKSPSYPHSTR